ncbi:MAG: PqqD family protein [Acidimicrobiales bacterium]
MPPEAESETIGPIVEILVVSRRPDVAMVELDGEAVLYDDGTNRAHVLNRVATLLWNCFEHSVRLADLIDELAEAFESDRATIQTDVFTVVRTLATEGLLEGVGDRGPVRRDHAQPPTGAANPSATRDPRFLAEPPSP